MRRVLTAFLLLAMLLSVPAMALTEEEMDAAVEAAGRAAIASCVGEDMTDLEKLTVLHDWMALHCDYGATPRGETAYGALAEGSAVCTGYAAGYAALTALAGLEGTATYSEELDHAWILVTLDGSRYFTDCTWDDGKYQRAGFIRHRYFLFDQWNARQVGHYGWDSPEAVPGGALETVPWADAVTRVVFDGAFAYYFDSGFRLVRCDRDTWATEVLTERRERWPDAEPTDNKTPELYTSLVFMRGRLYFNTPDRICYYDLVSGQVRDALIPRTAGRCVYGLLVTDGTLRYTLAENESVLDYDVVDTHISARGAWGY